MFMHLCVLDICNVYTYLSYIYIYLYLENMKNCGIMCEKKITAGPAELSAGKAQLKAPSSALPGSLGHWGNHRVLEYIAGWWLGHPYEKYEVSWD